METRTTWQSSMIKIYNIIYWARERRSQWYSEKYCKILPSFNLHYALFCKYDGSSLSDHPS